MFHIAGGIVLAVLFLSLLPYLLQGLFFLLRWMLVAGVVLLIAYTCQHTGTPPAYTTDRNGIITARH